MIDYLALMLINMAAGLVLLGLFLLAGIGGDGKSWAVSFGIVGLIALVTGFAMTFSWPLIGPYNSLFGETTIMLGAIFAGIAVSLAFGWDIAPLAVFSFFAAAAAILLGIRIINLGMTAKPGLSGVGFIITGVGGVLTALAFCMRMNKVVRTLAALALFAGAVIWIITGYSAFWAHMGSDNFQKYTPPAMRQASTDS